MFGEKSFKLYDLNSCTTFVSRDVFFFENTFPYKSEKQDILMCPVLAHIVDFGFESVTSPSVTSQVSQNSFHADLEINNNHSPIIHSSMPDSASLRS